MIKNLHNPPIIHQPVMEYLHLNGEHLTFIQPLIEIYALWLKMHPESFTKVDGRLYYFDKEPEHSNLDYEIKVYVGCYILEVKGSYYIPPSKLTLSYGKELFVDGDWRERYLPLSSIPSSVVEEGVRRRWFLGVRVV